MVLATICLYAVAEVVMGQVIEPRFRGRSTGLSPLAGILAMMFWTWAWGPIGLIVATPLTVLLVVLGKHVDSLDFLEVLLGAAPALTPAQIFYQRLLVGDPEEAASQAELQLTDRTVLSYADEIALPGLQLAQTDLQRGTVTAVRAAAIRQSLDQLIEYLPDPISPVPPSNQKQSGDVLSTELDDEESKVSVPIRLPVLIVGGRTALDQAAGAILARVLLEQGQASTVVASNEAITALQQPGNQRISSIAISYLNGAAAVSHSRFMQRRIRRSLPDVRIILCVWDEASTLAGQSRGDTAADGVAHTMAEACNLLLVPQLADVAGNAPLLDSA